MWTVFQMKCYDDCDDDCYDDCYDDDVGQFQINQTVNKFLK